VTIPKWNDPKLKAGTMIRTALWLISEVGLGNSFTKEQHRGAFSGVAQADRRLRDLRDYGWVIHTSAEDASLNPEEQRLVTIGSPVWEPGARKHEATDSVTAKIRRETFAENDFQCVVCGIAGGEVYPDATHVVAVLSASRKEVTVRGGRKVTMFVSECKRCRAGATTNVIDVVQMLAEIGKLDAGDRAVFRRWSGRGRRGALDRIWADFRRLPAGAKDEVRRVLKH
jgi:hypothetical protein